MKIETNTTKEYVLHLTREELDIVINALWFTCKDGAEMSTDWGDRAEALWKQLEVLS